MSDYHAGARSVPTGRADMAVDAGLRAFMLGIYNKMALGLALTAWGSLLPTPSNMRILFSFFGLITFLAGVFVYLFMVPAVG